MCFFKVLQCFYLLSSKLKMLLYHYMTIKLFELNLMELKAQCWFQFI